MWGKPDTSREWKNDPSVPSDRIDPPREIQERIGQDAASMFVT
jgi:hypothetical protein